MGMSVSFKADIMKSLQGLLALLIATLTIVNCGPLEHLVAKTEDEQRLLESVNLMEDVAARDMYAWWATYEGEIQAYRDAFDDLVCSDPDTLRAQLEAIDLQVQRVRNGWREKKNQLNAIKDILHDEKYKGVTGLVDVLNQYIEEQFTKAEEEDTKISAEEKDVVDERTKLNSHPCPCELSDWSEYGACNAECGGGTMTRTRDIIKEPVNGGATCESLGPLEQTAPCNEDPCPIDCEWASWSEWGECDKTCGPGFRHRNRGKVTEAEFGGEECTGPAEESVACNLMAELQLALDTCQAENTRLKQQLNCDVSKCAITVYKQCDQAESCGTKNGVSCAYLPDGLGETECATMPCPAVAGSADGPQTVCSDGVAIEITGGCHGYLSNESVSFKEVFAPGFTGLRNKMESVDGNEITISENFDKAHLFCKAAK